MNGAIQKVANYIPTCEKVANFISHGGNKNKNSLIFYGMATWKRENSKDWKGFGEKLALHS